MAKKGLKPLEGIVEGGHILFFLGTLFTSVAVEAAIQKAKHGYFHARRIPHRSQRYEDGLFTVYERTDWPQEGYIE